MLELMSCEVTVAAERKDLEETHAMVPAHELAADIRNQA
jgi:hypothetical protein